MIQNNLSLQMRWIKEYSVQHHLKKMPPCPASTYWIDDHFPLPYDASTSERYEDHEWVAVFNEAWGGESRIGVYPGLDLRSHWEKYRPILNKYCYLTAYDPEGPQAKLTIRPGRNIEGVDRPIGGTADLVMWYWWYRYVHRSKFEWFVLSVTEVTLTVLPETSPAPVSASSLD